MDKPNKPNKANKPRKLRLELPNNLNATYANAVIVSQTHSEIVLDFIQTMPNDPRARIQSRVVLTPSNAKLFLDALKTNLERYEQRHGDIKLPPTPTSLADQLFGGVPFGMGENDEEADESDDDNG